MVELRARFDEEANISLADRLQEAGVQVVYGVVGYKTHAKMMLIVRREGTTLRRYVHLGTGNYHAGTARAYTDIGLMTADPEIGEDVHGLFQQLTGLAPGGQAQAAAAVALHAAQRPAAADRARGRRTRAPASPARIIAKMNALNEAGVIRALYGASQRRRADRPDRARRLLPAPGRARACRRTSACARWSGASSSTAACTGSRNDGKPEIFCSSADWMERNLLRRVETCFPILDPELAQRVFDEELGNYLADNPQAWQLHADGSYTPHPAGATARCRYSAQGALLGRAGAMSPMRASSRARCQRRRTARRGRPGLEQLPHGGGALRARPAAHRRPHQGTRAPGRGPRRQGRPRRGSAWRARSTCLARFGQRLRDHAAAAACARSPPTPCARCASRRPSCCRPKPRSGHGIEVVSGREEARLIYLGVAHGNPAARQAAAGDRHRRRLHRVHHRRRASRRWSARACRWAASPPRGASSPTASCRRSAGRKRAPRSPPSSSSSPPTYRDAAAGRR